MVSPPAPDNEYWHNICDHRNTLMRFRSQFGIEAIAPRIYSKTALLNESIVDDFAQAIGLQFSENEYVKPKRLNKSMTVTGLEILRRINQKIPALGDSQRPNQLLRDIISFVLRHFKVGDLYSMPMEIQRQYEEAFRESNEWVRSEYFPNRQTLF